MQLARPDELAHRHNTYDGTRRHSTALQAPAQNGTYGRLHPSRPVARIAGHERLRNLGGVARFRVEQICKLIEITKTQVCIQPLDGSGHGSCRTSGLKASLRVFDNQTA